MINSWNSSNYLGHTNLKTALDSIKRSITNVALTAPGLIIYPDTVTEANNQGGQLRVSTTFAYRIEDTTYIKGVGITQTVNTGDKTCNLIPLNTGDDTAAGDYDITSKYYRAGVLLIDADGVWSVIMSDTEAGNAQGLTAGGRAQALAYLVDQLSTTDISDKAIVAFYVIGQGTGAYTATTSLVIATDVDLYQLGGMALSTGQSTDGNQILALI